MTRSQSFSAVVLCLLSLSMLLTGCLSSRLHEDLTGVGTRESAAPLCVVVMDPLSAQLASNCVAGYAQRRYDLLGEFLSRRLGRAVDIAATQDLARVVDGSAVAGGVDVIIGAYSEVCSDAARLGVEVHALALLSDLSGRIDVWGEFLVRRDDSAKTLDDIAGYRLLLGPSDSAARHQAALAALEAHGIEGATVRQSPGCSVAATAVLEGEADAVVVSSYATPLLVGCGAVEEGSLRRIGKTGAVPFVCVFVADAMAVSECRQLSEALAEVRSQSGLLAELQSRDGFIPFDVRAFLREFGTVGWADWRGPERNGVNRAMSATVPERCRLLWSRPLTGFGLSGLTLRDGRLLVADKSLVEDEDIYRCIEADTGRQIWSLRYPASGDMDYGNSPRAVPVVCQEHVYTLGAFGDLHCVDVRTGKVRWRRNISRDFAADVPMWGTCSTPLVLDDKLIVNPGAAQASVVALNRWTGEETWRVAGDPPAYASFIAGTFGGVRQIVGYDSRALSGWDPVTGERLWRLVPDYEGDFNVPTPVRVDGKLLVSTENNGTRLYRFDAQGKIVHEPVAVNRDLSPDTSSPVVTGGLVFGVFGGLTCLSLDEDLETLWQEKGGDFADYCSLMARDGLVVATTLSGRLVFFAADARRFRAVRVLEPFAGDPRADREVWAHPVLLGDRLYLRDQLYVYCFLLE